MSQDENSNEIQIEEGIPVPARSAGRQTVYPFAKMSVGNSFFVPNRTTKEFASTTAAARKRLNFKFTTRQETNAQGVQGLRVWRIE